MNLDEKVNDFLARHFADTESPLDDEWLAKIGGKLSFSNYLFFGADKPNTCQVCLDVCNGAVTIVLIPPHGSDKRTLYRWLGNKTKGQFLSLLKGLGIEIKESS